MPTKYIDEFKIEAVNHALKNNYPIKEVALRLGVHLDSLKTFKILSEKYCNRRKRFGLRFNLNLCTCKL
jgi:hypothetical protein